MSNKIGLHRGQSAIELLMIVSFFLVFSIPLISLVYLNATQSSQDASLLQGKQALREIMRASDSVYIQGNGSVEILVANFPPSLQRIASNGKELSFTLRVSSGETDVVAMGIAEIRISGGIGTEAGPHRLAVRSQGSFVEIGAG